MNETQFYKQIESYKLIANHSLGQNFLIKPELAKTIVVSLNITKEDNVLEIGAGLGSLSFFLAQSQASINLIDVDERMIAHLNDVFNNNPNVIVRRQNILKDDLVSFTKIIGNLPYYITTGIIEKLLLEAVNAKEMVLMIQKEVLPKLLPTSKEISPLQLYLNYVAKVEFILNVNRTNFAPAPHVDSVVFKIIPNNNIKNPDRALLYKTMLRIFLHRRKTILNCLNDLVKDKSITISVLEKLNIDERLRPEQLKMEDYIALTNELKQLSIIKG